MQAPQGRSAWWVVNWPRWPWLRHRQRRHSRFSAIRVPLPEPIRQKCNDLRDGIGVRERLGRITNRVVPQALDMKILVCDHVALQVQTIVCEEYLAQMGLGVRRAGTGPGVVVWVPGAKSRSAGDFDRLRLRKVPLAKENHFGQSILERLAAWIRRQYQATGENGDVSLMPKQQVHHRPAKGRIGTCRQSVNVIS